MVEVAVLSVWNGATLYCLGSTCKGWILYVFLGTYWDIQLRGCGRDFGLGTSGVSAG